MSDAYLRFVPTEPRFQPVTAAASDAERLLATFLPNAESISSTFTDEVQFVDPGANWSGVRCPSCGADAEEWWPDAMDAASTSQFEDLMTVTPCCQFSVSLNELQYLWPAAFARFILEAVNPNARAIPELQLRQLEVGLGCRLRQIAAHV